MTFFQNSTTQENIRISILKRRLKNLCKKENFTPESKPMIEIQPDELCQSESEHAKGTKLHENIIMELKEKKFSKAYSNVLTENT